MNSSPIVYVVDDDQHMRESLCRLLKSAGIAAQAFATAEDFLETGLSNRFGCVVLDVRMPGMSGLELQSQMKSLEIHLPIVMISGYAEVPNVVKSVKMGAIDFLEKPFSDHDFLERVHQALELSRERQGHDHQRQALEHRLSLLTPREREVLQLLIEGLTTKQIAARLNISSKTADIHRGRVLQKTEMESVVQLANLIYRAIPK